MQGEIFVYLFTAFASIFIVSRIAEGEFLNNAFKRGVGGSTLQIGSSYYLIGYTNFVSFIDASLNGDIGIPGYLFVMSLAFLVSVYAFNLYKYKVAIV